MRFGTMINSYFRYLVPSFWHRIQCALISMTVYGKEIIMLANLGGHRSLSQQANSSQQRGLEVTSTGAQAAFVINRYDFTDSLYREYKAYRPVHEWLAP
jgi:hypothetical protein